MQGVAERRASDRADKSMLTTILYRIISSFVPFARGRFMRRLGAERDATPAGGGTTYPRALGRPGSPSGPTTGVCRSLSAGRGIGGGGKPPGGRARCPKPRHVPGSTVPAPEDAAVARSQASRFAAMRIASQSTTPAPVGAPPPLTKSRGELPHPSGARRRENDSGWLFEA